MKVRLRWEWRTRPLHVRWCRRRRQQRSDLLADARRVGIGNEEPDVVAKVGERRLLLQLEEHVAEDARAARVERVDGQRADVGVLDEVALHARREVRAVDERAADGRLGQAERAAHLADESARVLFVRRREQRPERVDAVDGGEDVSVRRREHRREADRSEEPEQRVARRDDVLARSRLRASPPSVRRASPTWRTRGRAAGASGLRARLRGGGPRWSTMASGTESSASTFRRSESARWAALRSRLSARAAGRRAARYASA